MEKKRAKMNKNCQSILCSRSLPFRIIPDNPYIAVFEKADYFLSFGNKDHKQAVSKGSFLHRYF